MNLRDLKMESDYSDSDISWLTQVPRKEFAVADFKIYSSSESEDELIVDNGVGHQKSYEKGVQLEGELAGKILYDNVVVKDISSDENIDTM